MKPKVGSSSNTFNPTAECVVSGNQKKKKAAIRSKQRAVNVSVVMMKKYSPTIPKGKERQNLAAEGRILNMKVTRGMSAKEVKDKISKAFEVSNYTSLNVTAMDIVCLSDVIRILMVMLLHSDEGAFISVRHSR